MSVPWWKALNLYSLSVRIENTGLAAAPRNHSTAAITDILRLLWGEIAVCATSKPF